MKAILCKLNRRSRILALTGLCALSSAGLVRADDVIPKAFPADRYAKMASHSPFTPPTQQAVAGPTPTPPPAPGFADKMTATMISRDDNGVYNVMIVDPDSSQHLFLSSKEEDEQSHLQVASVKWPTTNNDEPGARQTPEITLRKGTAFATVRYEPGGAGGGGPMGGGPTGAMGGGLNRPFIPGNAVRPPGMSVLPGGNAGGVSVAPPPPPAPAAQLANGVRRTPIRSFPAQQPAAPNLPAANRPVLPGNTALSGKAVNVDDDDDDDDGE